MLYQPRLYAGETLPGALVTPAPDHAITFSRGVPVDHMGGVMGGAIATANSARGVVADTTSAGALMEANIWPTGAYTIFARFLVNTIANYRMLVSNYQSSATGRVWFGVGSSGLTLQRHGSAVSVSGVVTGQWHDGFGWADTESAGVELDGAPVAGAIYGADPYDIATSIGELNGGSYPSDGQIEVVLIWPRVLGDAERAAVRADPLQWIRARRVVTPSFVGSSTGAVVADAVCRVDWGASARDDSVLPIDYRAQISGDQSLAVERVLSVSSDALNLVEAVASVSADAVIPVEWTGGSIIAADAVLPIEWSAEAAASATLLVESGIGITAQRSISVEHLARALSDAALPIEWSGGVLIAADAVLPIVWSATVAADGEMAIDALQSLFAEHPMPVGVGGGVAADCVLPVAVLRRTEADAAALVAYEGTVISGQPVAIEWLVDVAGVDDLPVDAVMVVESGAELPIEWGGSTLAFVLGVRDVWRAAPRGYAWSAPSRGTTWAASRTLN